MEHIFQRLQGSDRLTPSQRLMVDLLAHDCSDACIARVLGKSQAEVQRDLRDVRDALGAVTQKEFLAICRAIKRSALPPRPGANRGATQAGHFDAVCYPEEVTISLATIVAATYGFLGGLSMAMVIQLAAATLSRG